MPNHNHRKSNLGGDIDGFFGLLVDNLIQILVILFLLDLVVPIPREIVLKQIMPAMGISVVFGNLFYALQAWLGSRREDKRKTALPYGINTPSIFVYVLFIMLPIYLQTNSWEAAYAAGMVACIGSGLIEFFGAFSAQWIRKHTPRAALLSALAGIALTFIAMDFVVRIFSDPLIALIPLVILLAGYFGKARMPLGLPAGLVALVIGAASAWILTEVNKLGYANLSWIINDEVNLRDTAAVSQSLQNAGWYLPDPRVVWPQIKQVFITQEWVQYLGVIIPMGLFNLVGSMQNLESAEASGDSYGTTSSLTVNGLGSILGGFLGSCFPTTIYIGHPGWKSMGAGWSYSLLNALAIGGLCLTGIATVVESVVPIAAGAGILLWIGVIMLAQAFTATPQRHAGAVAIGLFPALAGLLILIAFAPYQPGPAQIQATADLSQATNQDQARIDVETGTADDSPPDINEIVIPDADLEPIPTTDDAPDNALIEAPQFKLSTVQDQLESENPAAGRWSGFSIHGLIRLERGLLLISMIWAAITALLIDRRWRAAALWAFTAAGLTALGVIHSYAISGNDLYYLIPGLAVPAGALESYAYEFIVAYGLIGILLFIASTRRDSEFDFESAPAMDAEAPELPDDQAARLRQQVRAAHDNTEPIRFADDRPQVEMPKPANEDDDAEFDPPMRPI